MRCPTHRAPPNPQLLSYRNVADAMGCCPHKGISAVGLGHWTNQSTLGISHTRSGLVSWIICRYTSQPTRMWPISDQSMTVCEGLNCGWGAEGQGVAPTSTTYTSTGPGYLEAPVGGREWMRLRAPRTVLCWPTPKCTNSRHLSPGLCLVESWTPTTYSRTPDQTVRRHKAGGIDTFAETKCVWRGGTGEEGSCAILLQSPLI